MILDYIDVGIHIVDKDGKTVYYNKYAQQIEAIDPKKGSRSPHIRSLSLSYLRHIYSA